MYSKYFGVGNTGFEQVLVYRSYSILFQFFKIRHYKAANVL